MCTQFLHLDSSAQGLGNNKKLRLESTFCTEISSGYAMQQSALAFVFSATDVEKIAENITLQLHACLRENFLR